MRNLEALQEAIEFYAKCKAVHLRSEAVKEVFQGQTVWNWQVEVFELKGHPEAKLAYGWGFKDGKREAFVTVLGISPVENSKDAFKAFIFDRHKNF